MSVYDSLEELNVDDPWIAYNKWREARQQMAQPVVPDEEQNCIQSVHKAEYQELSTNQTSSKPVLISDCNPPVCCKIIIFIMCYIAFIYEN